MTRRTLLAATAALLSAASASAHTKIVSANPAAGATVAAAAIKPRTSEKLPAGSYRVHWYAVSGDTHRVTGTHAFTVK